MKKKEKRQEQQSADSVEVTSQLESSCIKLYQIHSNVE